MEVPVTAQHDLEHSHLLTLCPILAVLHVNRPKPRCGQKQSYGLVTYQNRYANSLTTAPSSVLLQYHTRIQPPFNFDVTAVLSSYSADSFQEVYLREEEV